MIGHDVEVEEDTSYGLLDGNNLKSKSKARTAASLALVGLCGLALFTARSLLLSGEAATAPLATPTLSSRIRRTVARRLARWLATHGDQPVQARCHFAHGSAARLDV